MRTAVSFCLSNQCAADAVRKLHVIDLAEAKRQEREKERQALLESNKTLRLTLELVRKRSEIWFELQREANEESRKLLPLQLDELKFKLEQVLETRKAVEK